MTQDVLIILKEGVDKASFFTKVSAIEDKLGLRPDRFKAYVTEDQLAALEAHSDVHMVITRRKEFTRSDLKECAIKYVDFTRRNIEGSSSHVNDANLDYTGNKFGNWGLIRHSSLTNNTTAATTTSLAPFTQNYTGVGVDVVMQVASMLDRSDPEFRTAANAQRIVELQWRDLDPALSGMGAVDYSSTVFDSHAESVSYLAVGKKYGWATGAAIYVLPRDQIGTGNLEDFGWDAIRIFHEQKVAAGNTRPTIVIDSMAWVDYNFMSNTQSLYLREDFVENIVYGNEPVPIHLTGWIGQDNHPRGTGANWGLKVHKGGRFYPSGTQLTDPVLLKAFVEDPANDYEYQDRGIALEEMIEAGVHHVSAAGNYQSTLIMAGHPHYNDGKFYHDSSAPWTKGAFYTIRRSNSCLAGDTIAVAAIASGFNQFTALGGNEHLAGFSCRGERVDCAAAGHNINMDLYNNGYYNANGTSFASPNIGGMAACVLEKYPDTPPRKLRKYFRDVAVGTDKLHDSGIGESDVGSDRLDDLFYGNALSCRGYSGNIAYLDPNLVADPRTQTNDPIVSPASLTDVTIDYSVAEIQTKLDGLP